MTARLFAPVLLLFAFSGCQALGGAGLAGVLSQLGEYASGVSNWQQALPAVIGDTDLGKLGELVSQAGSLRGSVTDALGSVPTETKDGFSGVLGSLQDMSGLDVQSLKDQGSQQERQDAVSFFGNAASSLGGSVGELLKSGLPGIGG